MVRICLSILGVEFPSDAHSIDFLGCKGYETYLEVKCDEKLKAQVHHGSQLHTVFPDFELEVVNDVSSIEREHLVLNLLKHEVTDEDAMGVLAHDKPRRIIGKRGIDIVHTIPLVLDDSVQNTAIEHVIKGVSVQIPKDVVTFIIRHITELEHFARIDIHLKHRNQLFRQLFLQDPGGVLRVLELFGELVY